jgi:hypothetical protein
MDVVVGEGTAGQIEGDRAGSPGSSLTFVKARSSRAGRRTGPAAVATYTWTTCWPARAPVLVTATEARAVSGPVTTTVRSLTAKVV